MSYLKRCVTENQPHVDVWPGMLPPRLAPRCWHHLQRSHQRYLCRVSDDSGEEKNLDFPFERPKPKPDDLRDLGDLQRMPETACICNYKCIFQT
jgi:hypothetical protein